MATATKKTDAPAPQQGTSPFAILNAIDCSDKSEKKNGLTFLSWAWAWARVKENFPNAFYTIYENEQGFPYFTDGKTAWVKTGVTIEGLEHIEYLPIMNDAAHASLPVGSITSWHVNKAIQRSLTKACARHGLGLYIYAGEDLPETVAEEKKPTKPGKPQATPATQDLEKVPISDSLEFKPLDKETYWKAVKAAAEGVPTKSGVPIRQWYTKTTHAGQKEIEQFDLDVQDYKAAVLNK